VFPGDLPKSNALKTGKGSDMTPHIVMVHRDIVTGKGSLLDPSLVLGIPAFRGPKIEKIPDKGGIGYGSLSRRFLRGHRKGKRFRQTSRGLGRSSQAALFNL
jgi:hypothetical protein